MGVTLPASAIVAQNLDECIYDNVLTELDHSHRDKLASLFSKSLTIKNSQAMLWRIDKPGKSPSWLFGTVHVPNSQLQSLTPAVRNALDQAPSVIVESMETSQRARKYAMLRARRLMSANDKPLQRILSDDELKIVEQAMSAAGFPEAMALTIKPWVATLFLADSACQKQKRTVGMKTLDQLIIQYANSKGRRVAGLENMLEQYQTLASVDDDAQKVWLRATIETHNRIDAMANAMAELYLFRRIGILWDLLEPLAPQSGLNQDILRHMRQKLIVERNERMLERLKPLVDEGGVFAAVGALHIVGIDGLVELFRRAGYTVTAIE